MSNRYAQSERVCVCGRGRSGKKARLTRQKSRQKISERKGDMLAKTERTRGIDSFI